MRALLLLVLVLLCPSLAQAKSIILAAPPYAGATTALTSTGYRFNQATLRAPSSPSLQFPLPYTVSYGIKGTPTVASSTFIDNREPAAFTGFFMGICASTSCSLAFALSHLEGYGPSEFGGINCSNLGQNCARAARINDGQWHNVCWLVPANNLPTQMYIDGVLADNNTNPRGNFYAATTQPWRVLVSNNTASAMRDIRVYNISIGSQGCRDLGRLASQGLTPSSGALQSNLAAHWPLDNCTGVGCADTSGNGNDLSNGLIGPVCSITSPANGSIGLTGSVTMEANCTDPAGVTAVLWFVDGAWVATSHAAPWTTPWDSTQFIDGTHTISLIGQNASSVQTNLAITVSTLNGTVTTKTVYYDPVGGTDPVSSPGTACQTTLAPCQTLHGVQLVINANPLHGGDSILQKAGTNLNITTMGTGNTLAIGGPSCTAAVCNGITQNAYPGAPITFSTYGGSGDCHILSGITTDCASITLSANPASTPRDGSMINIWNVPNMVIQNLRIFGSQPTAQTCASGSNSGCNTGLRYASANGYFNGVLTNPYASLITNNEVVDFFISVFLGGANDNGQGFDGQWFCGLNVTDNYVHGSTIASPIDAGISAFNTKCQFAIANPQTAATFTSNFLQWIGGSGKSGSGVGIGYLNSSQGEVANFNAIGSLDFNENAQCGAGYSLETFQVVGALWKGNEAYNNFNSTGGGCDNGAYDLDISTNQATVEFNYAHLMMGPAIGEFGVSSGTIVPGGHTIAYNIFENTRYGDNQIQSGGMGLDNGAFGPTNWFNNSVWNGANGTIYPAGRAMTKTAAWSIGGHCPIVTTDNNYVANNIFVSNSGPNVAFTAFIGTAAGGGTTGKNCNTLTWANNNYFKLGTQTISWINVIANSNPTSVAAWNTLSGETPAGTNIDQNFAGSGGGTGTVCYAPLTGASFAGAPTQATCPTNYQLRTNNGLIGTGLDLTQSPYDLPVPATDFFNGAIPNGGAGTQYNVGADGAQH